MKYFFILALIFQLSWASSTAPDIQKIIDRGTLRVALCKLDTPPFFYTSPDGELHGIDIDLSKSIAGKLGVKLEFIRPDTFDKVIQATANGTADIAISELSITFERAKKVYYTQPYFKLKMAALINHLKLGKETEDCTGKHNLNRKGIKLGILANSSYEIFAKDNFPEAELVKIKSWPAMIKAALDNEVDALFYDEVAMELKLREDPSLSLKFKYAPIECSCDPIAIAVPLDSPVFFEWIKHYLSLNPVNPNLKVHFDEYFRRVKPHTFAKKSDPNTTLKKILKISMLCIVVIIAGILYFKNKGKHFSKRISWLLSPWTVLFSIFAGVILGVYFKEESKQLEIFGDLYLTLLQMCSLPIMLTAIITSIGKLFQSKAAGAYLKKLLLLIASSMILASIAGVAGGLIGEPGHLSESSRMILGNIIHENTESTSSSLTFTDFLRRIIPDNIFNALSHNDVLGILSFSLLVGISLGFLKSETTENVFSFMEGLFNSFLQIIGWSMYILPFALFCLIAKQISHSGVEIMLAMGRFVIVYYILTVGFILFAVILMSRRMSCRIRDIFINLKEPFIIALGTANSYASMPLAIENLQTDFKLDRDTVNLVMPLGITICRPGTVLNLALGTIFIAQILSVDLLSGYKFLIVAVGVLFSAAAAAGAPSAIEISMLSIVFGFLGLPIEVAMILLIAIDPITDPIRTLLNVITSCGITTVIATEKK